MSPDVGSHRPARFRNSCFLAKGMSEPIVYRTRVCGDEALTGIVQRLGQRPLKALTWVRVPLPVPAPARDAQSASCYGYALAADALYADTGLLRAASLPDRLQGW